MPTELGRIAGLIEEGRGIYDNIRKTLQYLLAGNTGELLRSFGARSETKPVWHISLFTNINLVLVVGISFGLQVWGQHNAILGRFLKTSSMPLADCFLLLAAGAIPLLTLEMVKVCGTLCGEERGMNPCARSKAWVNGALKEPRT